MQVYKICHICAIRKHGVNMPFLNHGKGVGRNQRAAPWRKREVLQAATAQQFWQRSSQVNADRGAFELCVRIRQRKTGGTLPKAFMEAPRTPLEDLVPFTEAFWELPC